jgi:hypothetical protein
MQMKAMFACAIAIAVAARTSKAFTYQPDKHAFTEEIKPPSIRARTNTKLLYQQQTGVVVSDNSKSRWLKLQLQDRGDTITIISQSQQQQSNDELQLLQSKTKTHDCIFQRNNNLGWMWMAAYWSVGAIVSIMFGYTPSWKLIDSPFTHLHAMSLAITIGMASLFLQSTTNFGRPRNTGCILASFTFAALNGVFETILFLASYDLGSKWLHGILRTNHAFSAVALGLLTHFTYSGVIHAFFWLPKALPAHRRPSKKPFYVRGLPELTMISVSWMTMYVFTNDIAFICLLHFILNFYGNLKMGLQLPSLKMRHG